MKIILSRKGFDSAFGRVPSPILPDGRLISLPIPSSKKRSSIRYKDIKHGGYKLGKIVADLTNGRVLASHRAHLDPDLCARCYPRRAGWKPLFGQGGAAQGHLRRQGVQPGDLFLFFGLFQRAVIRHKTIEVEQGTKRIHAIWGWLQVDDIVSVDSADRKKLRWALYHPHFHMAADKNNIVYIGKPRLAINGLSLPTVPGGGRFTYLSDALRLTSKGSSKCSEWMLPAWFEPSGGRPALTYHADPQRWKRRGDHVLLRSVALGQEFVFDTEYYPEALAWVGQLMQRQK